MRIPLRGLRHTAVLHRGEIETVTLVEWIAIDVRFSDRVAEIAHGLVLAVSAAMMAVLASMFGGPASPYVHGLSIAFIVRATVVPSRPWACTTRCARTPRTS